MRPTKQPSLGLKRHSYPEELPRGVTHYTESRANENTVVNGLEEGESTHDSPSSLKAGERRLASQVFIPNSYVHGMDVTWTLGLGRSALSKSYKGYLAELTFKCPMCPTFDPLAMTPLSP